VFRKWTEILSLCRIDGLACGFFFSHRKSEIFFASKNSVSFHFSSTDCEGRRTLQTSVGLGWPKYAIEAQTRVQGCAEVIVELEIERFIDRQGYYRIWIKRKPGFEFELEIQRFIDRQGYYRIWIKRKPGFEFELEIERFIDRQGYYRIWIKRKPGFEFELEIERFIGRQGYYRIWIKRKPGYIYQYQERQNQVLYNENPLEQ
jgi:hypothetical protein